MRGRLIGPKTWDRIVEICLDIFCQSVAVGADFGVYMIIYGINYALVRIRPEMAVKFGFTK